MCVCGRCARWTWQPCQLSWCDGGRNGGRYRILGQLPQDLELASALPLSLQAHLLTVGLADCETGFTLASLHEGLFISETDEWVRSSLRSVARSCMPRLCCCFKDVSSFLVASNNSAAIVRRSSSSSSSLYVCCVAGRSRFAWSSLSLVGRLSTNSHRVVR